MPASPPDARPTPSDANADAVPGRPPQDWPTDKEAAEADRPPTSDSAARDVAGEKPYTAEHETYHNASTQEPTHPDQRRDAAVPREGKPKG